MAIGRELFRLYGTVDLEGGDKTETQLENIDQKGETANKRMTGFGSTISKVGKGLVVGATAIAGAATGLFKMAQSSADATDRIDKMSQKIQFSRQGFQEWDFILSQNGASVDGLQMGMKTLTSAIFEAGKGTGTYVDALTGVGLTYEQLAGMSPEEQFEAVFAALQNVEDETTRAALANDLLGRSASELMPALNAGAEAIEAQREQAHELGLVLGDEAVDAGVEFTDLLDQLTRTLKGGFLNIMSQLMPIVNQLLSTLITQAPVIMQMLQPIFDALIPVLPILIDALMQILNAIIPLLPLIADLIANLLPPLLDLIIPLMELMVEILTKILPPLIPVITAVANVLVGVLGVAFEALSPLIDNAIGIFTGLIDFITGVFTGDWEKAWGGIVDMFGNIFEGLGNLVKAPINMVIGLINKLFENIGSINLPDFLGGGSISLPQIPKLANGTDYFQGGMMIAGDDPRTGGNGELITAPKGSKVYTAEETRKMLGDTIINVNGDTSPSGIIKAVRRNSWLEELGVV